MSKKQYNLKLTVSTPAEATVIREMALYALGGGSDAQTAKDYLQSQLDIGKVTFAEEYQVSELGQDKYGRCTVCLGPVNYSGTWITEECALGDIRRFSGGLWGVTLQEVDLEGL
ncbi:MAG TPA: hypothetical protein VMW41_00260 [Candidatus Bathyarchaeia archaeon]|nr:hypothetical protein [Candidatus Bathyarchaeia archaeon]